MTRHRLINSICLVICLTMLITGCGGNSGGSSGSASQAAAPATDASAETEVKEEPTQSAETKEDKSFSLKSSPDKYTQYVGKYVGMNAASVGYTSLGGDRMVEIGKGLLQITYVTADGTYVGPDDEENLKNYVVTAQSIEPNTEVKLTFQKDSDGKEYDNLVDHQSFDKIDLAVKKVNAADDSAPELTSIDPSPDKYTYYIRNYVGKNLASVGYQSLGDDYRDAYGAGSLELILVSDDGSYIDTSDSSVLKQYVVTDQDIAPNSELKLNYMTDSNGEEYTNLVDSQSYETITLTVAQLDGVELAESENTEDEDSEEDSEEETKDIASSGIRPEIKKAIDDYEVFMDQYVEFMETYDASDFSMLTKYAELLEKYSEMTDSMEALEKDLNDEELEYYTEVSLRVSQKLLEASQNM